MPPAKPLFACALALLLSLAARAQDAPPAPPSAPATPKTLAQALAEAEQPKSDVFLAVAADKTALPKDAAPPDKDLPPAQVAEAFGRITYGFESVTAIAPPTMTLLNTEPGTPNPYDGMPPSDVLKLLLGGLSDAQWGALTGSAGLGLADLPSDTQREQFLALFPGDHLTLHTRHDGGDFSPHPEDKAPKLTRDDLQQVRLRLGQAVQIGIPVAGKNGQEWMDAPMHPAGGQVQYEVYSGDNGENARDVLYGVKVRAVVPNAPKPSDLDGDALRRPIPLDGVKTVGDLIARIGTATRAELYADRRYEGRTVTLLGPAQARARDLLQALALCVCGTYRKVGPAYVLTDDQMGAGTRKLILARFAQQAELARHGPLMEAGDRLITARGGVDSLPLLDNSIAFSDAQKAQAAKDNPFPMPGQGTQVQAPLGQLTPAQQDIARRFFQQWNDAMGKYPGNEKVTLDGKLLVMAQPTLLLQAPSVAGPISLDSYFNSYNLFQASDKLRQQFQRAQQKQQATNPAPAAPAPPPLGPLLRAIPRRAVLARPRTAQDVDALVLSMRQTGMNALWLDVFSGGVAHLDGKPDILTEALVKTKGIGIAVFPVLDLLRWGTDTPQEARDLTMLGETSPEAEARQHLYEAVVYQDQSLEDAQKQPAPADVAVSPVAPSVQRTLLALAQRLAATPGVAGLILRETATSGYDRPADSHYGVQGEPFGYTLPLRLAFLRRDHVDPVDLDRESYTGQINADMSLPEFEDWRALGMVGQDWNVFRAGADRDFLQKILAAAQQAAGRRPELWIKQRRSSYQADWYGLWDDPRAPLPDLTEELAYGGYSPNTDFAAFAHTQSRRAMFELPSWAGTSAAKLAGNLQQMKPGWDDIVLDFSRETGGNPLADLAKSLTPQAAKPPNGPPPSPAKPVSAVPAGVAR
ncbi:MAG: hypothetical protein JO250_19520 [Armatimonadetes bacterium]|nr:hypothetical protein [Armatimonadota bacterium]